MVHILLVEDNLADVVMVQEALQHHEIEHTLSLASDGAEALRLIEKMGQPGELPPVDLLLLDVGLPKVDGTEVLEQLRKHPGCSRMPVIAISSAHAGGDRLKLGGLGIKRYFKKPHDLDTYIELGALIREVAAEAGLLRGKAPPFRP